MSPKDGKGISLAAFCSAVADHFGAAQLGNILETALVVWETPKSFQSGAKAIPKVSEVSADRPQIDPKLKPKRPKVISK